MRDIEQIKADMKYAEDNSHTADAIRYNNEMVNACKALDDWWRGLFPERKQEIMDAERDGRRVVLPCKVGDRVWVICDGEVIECIMDDAMRFKAIKYNLEIMRRFDGKIGKQQTVFLTPEEAEAALRKEQGK